MPEPKSKAQIIKRLETERRRLEQNLAKLSTADMLQPGVVDEWSVKDVLAHLADWEAHMPVWMEAGRRGDPVKEPDPGLTWKQLDLLNERIYQAHRYQSLAEVMDYFHSIHEQFMDMVVTMPEQEMLERGRYSFIGKGAVYGWLSQYAAHDAWGKRKIREWMKTRGEMKT
jgi:hypothetical protein